MTRKIVSDRERRIQAQARIRLIAGLKATEQRMLKSIKDGTDDIVFGFMMDAAAALSPDKVERVREILRAFRFDREHCTRKIVEIRMRELEVLLKDEPEPVVEHFPRWHRK